MDERAPSSVLRQASRELLLTSTAAGECGAKFAVAASNSGLPGAGMFQLLRSGWSAGVRACAPVREAVDGADIVVTVTTSAEPALAHGWLAPGSHVNAVGSSIPTTRELDADTVADGTGTWVPF